MHPHCSSLILFFFFSTLHYPFLPVSFFFLILCPLLSLSLTLYPCFSYISCCVLSIVSHFCLYITLYLSSIYISSPLPLIFLYSIHLRPLLPHLFIVLHSSSFIEFSRVIVLLSYHCISLPLYLIHPILSPICLHSLPFVLSYP